MPLIIVKCKNVIYIYIYKLKLTSINVKDGGNAFEKAQGINIWEFASKNPEYYSIFNKAMEIKNAVKIVVDGFGSIG